MCAEVRHGGLSLAADLAPLVQLKEVVLGSLTPRVPCGKVLTNKSTESYSYSGSTANVEYDSDSPGATIISNGQFCIQPKQPVRDPVRPFLAKAPTPLFPILEKSFIASCPNSLCAQDSSLPT